MDKQKLREIRNRHLHEKNAVESGINYIIEIKPTGLSSNIAIEEQHKDFIRNAYVDIDALITEVVRLQEYTAHIERLISARDSEDGAIYSRIKQDIEIVKAEKATVVDNWLQISAHIAKERDAAIKDLKAFAGEFSCCACIRQDQCNLHPPGMLGCSEFEWRGVQNGV